MVILIYAIAVIFIIACVIKGITYCDAAKYAAMREMLAGVSDFLQDTVYFDCDANSGIAIDNKNRKICVLRQYEFAKFEAHVVDFHDIIASEIIVDGNVAVKAVRGDQLPAGATDRPEQPSSQVRSVDLRLTLARTGQPTHQVKFMGHLRARRNDTMYNAAIVEASRCHESLTIFMEESVTQKGESTDSRGDVPPSAEEEVSMELSVPGEPKKSAVSPAEPSVAESTDKGFERLAGTIGTSEAYGATLFRQGKRRGKVPPRDCPAYDWASKQWGEEYEGQFSKFFKEGYWAFKQHSLENAKEIQAWQVGHHAGKKIRNGVFGLVILLFAGWIFWPPQSAGLHLNTKDSAKLSDTVVNAGDFADQAAERAREVEREVFEEAEDFMIRTGMIKPYKRCPECYENIHLKAKTCPYCRTKQKRRY